jgi:hypothetical protein
MSRRDTPASFRDPDAVPLDLTDLRNSQSEPKPEDSVDLAFLSIVNDMLEPYARAITIKLKKKFLNASDPRVKQEIQTLMNQSPLSLINDTQPSATASGPASSVSKETLIDPKAPKSGARMPELQGENVGNIHL